MPPAMAPKGTTEKRLLIVGAVNVSQATTTCGKCKGETESQRPLGRRLLAGPLHGSSGSQPQVLQETSDSSIHSLIHTARDSRLALVGGPLLLPSARVSCHCWHPQNSGTHPVKPFAALRPVKACLPLQLEAPRDGERLLCRGMQGCAEVCKGVQGCAGVYAGCAGICRDMYKTQLLLAVHSWC